MQSIVRTGTISPEPVTLTDMKNWLKVPLSETRDDLKITMLIKAARQHCELISGSRAGAVQASIVRSTFVMYLDHFPGRAHGWGDNEYMGGPLLNGYGGYVGFESDWDRNVLWRHLDIKIPRNPLVAVQPITFIFTDGRPYTLNPGQDFIVDAGSQPGRIRPVPGSVWPMTLHVPAAIAIPFTAGYAPNADSVGAATIAEPETNTEAVSNPEWQPDQELQQYNFVVDPNGNVEVQMNVGPVTTGAGPDQPSWGAIGTTTADGGASWLNCGPIRGFWTPATEFAGQNAWVILDFNSNLQLLNVDALTSQNIPPNSNNTQSLALPPLPWATALGGLTPDNGVANAWLCLGPYTALGNPSLGITALPEQQAAITVDRTLPETTTLAIMMLVQHFYFNREPLTPGSVSKVPFSLEDLLGEITYFDFHPNE